MSCPYCLLLGLDAAWGTLMQSVAPPITSTTQMWISRIACVGIGCSAVAGAWLTVSGCSAVLEPVVQVVTAGPRPLGFVGDVSLGTPAREGRRVIVPLSRTGGTWGMNSGACFYEVESRVSGREIDVTVVTAVCRSSVRPPPFRMVLRSVSSGVYTVYYRDPDGTRHRLGEIEIPD